jgi:hypothetical protein
MTEQPQIELNAVMEQLQQTPDGKIQLELAAMRAMVAQLQEQLAAATADTTDEDTPDTL